jgi:hypothetical protein
MLDGPKLEKNAAMAVASFEVFCADLCALMGVPAPPLEPSPAGVIGFTVEYRGAKVAFIKPDETREPGILMMVTFGTPPAEIEADVLRVLMEGNFLMMGMNAPVYARHPLTSEISLHHNFPLLQTDVHTIAAAIENAAEMAQIWARSYFLEMLPHESRQAASMHVGH